MKQFIDLEHWNRKEHFKFFSALDDPFFGLTTLVDFTTIYKRSKEEKNLSSYTPYTFYCNVSMKQKLSNYAWKGSKW